MTPTHSEKDAAALVAAAFVNALIEKGVPYPRAAKSGADLLLLGTGLLSRVEEEALAAALADFVGGDEN